jgi:sugar phosphate isomerase/epimerase
LDGLRAVMEYTADLGGKYALVICDDSEWNRAVDNLGRLADLAAESTLTAVVEGPIYGRLINTLPLVVKLVHEALRDNIAICIDTYQLLCSGADATSLGGIELRLLPYVQLTDGKADHVGFVVPGLGDVPLAEILAALPEDAPIGLECPTPKDSAWLPSEWLRTVMAGARDVLAQYATE